MVDLWKGIKLSQYMTPQDLWANIPIYLVSDTALCLIELAIKSDSKVERLVSNELWYKADLVSGLAYFEVQSSLG